MERNDVTQQALRLLAEAGIKASAQRLAVTSYLLTHRSHPTVDEIYTALLPANPTMSRTTVYNTLGRLVSGGAVTELDFGRGNSHYDSCIHPHAHFFCEQCGKIEDLAPDSWPQAPEGRKVRQTYVTFKGLCVDCASHADRQAAG